MIKRNQLNKFNELLMSFGDSIEWEAPDGCVYLDEISKIKSIKSIIEQLLNKELESDNHLDKTYGFK